KNTNSSSSTQSSLPDGATTGENNTQFRCEVCGERFTNEENRNIHRSGHYNNPFRR
ncbi:unnamed protein product, partial [Brassica oleracea var. botrytis]